MQPCDVRRFVRVMKPGRGIVLAEIAYSPGDLTRAFSGLVANPGSFVWKGVEIFWGTKP